MTEEAIGISYGRGHLPLQLPKGARATVIRKRQLPKLADPHAAIATAVNEPVASVSLSELAKALIT